MAKREFSEGYVQVIGQKNMCFMRFCHVELFYIRPVKHVFYVVSEAELKSITEPCERHYSDIASLLGQAVNQCVCGVKRVL